MNRKSLLIYIEKATGKPGKHKKKTQTVNERGAKKTEVKKVKKIMCICVANWMWFEIKVDALQFVWMVAIGWSTRILVEKQVWSCLKAFDTRIKVNATNWNWWEKSLDFIVTKLLLRLAACYSLKRLFNPILSAHVTNRFSNERTYLSTSCIDSISFFFTILM